jgi:glycine/D-amino acid oxidase-like deaminating enzyme
MRREGAGSLIGRGAVESDEEGPKVDWSFLDVVVGHSMHRAPPLAQAGVQAGWAGLRHVTPGDGPILGPMPHLHGFYDDGGWGGHGTMNALAAGHALAQWIVDGQAASVELSCFDAQRLASGVDSW